MKKYALFPLAAVICAVCGCSTVNVKPFSDFSDSMKKNCEEIQNALDADSKSSRKAFAEKFVSDSNSNFSELIDDSSSRPADSPSYAKIRDARKSLMEINDSFHSYSEFIRKLAECNFLNAEDLENSAKDLNLSFKKDLADADIPKKDESAPFLSDLSIKSGKEFLSSKIQKVYLKASLEENQKTFKEYCDICGTLAGIISSGLKNSYTKKAEKLNSEWEKAESPEKKKEAVDKMLLMNDNYTELAAILGSVQKYYEKLPQVHRALFMSIDNKAFFYEELQELNSETRNISRICKRLNREI